MTQAVHPLDPDFVQRGATLPPDDVYLFNEGRLLQIYRLLGAHQVHDGIRFAVWAPDAAEVSVVADFNGWTAGVDPLRAVGYSGIWVACVPKARTRCRYTYAIFSRRGGAPQLKADPFSQAFELPPRTASLAFPESEHVWRDREWLERHRRADWLHEPINIYEVHAGSWKRHWDGRFSSYRAAPPVRAPTPSRKLRNSTTASARC